MTARSRSASSPPSIATARPPSIVQVMGSRTWPSRPMPSMMPSTTAVPCVYVLDGGEGDLGPQRHRPHHLAALLDRRHLQRRAALDGDVEVGARRRGDVDVRLPLEHRHGVLGAGDRVVQVLDREAPGAHSRLDRGDLAVGRARLLDGRDVGEAVGPLEVGDDDDLVGGDHRRVQVARRRHREAHVGAAAAHLRARCSSPRATRRGRPRPPRRPRPARGSRRRR